MLSIRKIVCAFVLFIGIQSPAQNNKAQKALGNGFESLEKKNYNEAIKQLSEAIDLYPSYAAAFLYRGACYQNKNDLDNALKDYTEVIRLEPAWPSGFGNRGHIYYLKSQYDLAITDLREAVRLSPKTNGWHYYSGLVYFALKQRDNAIVSFTEAIRLDPKDKQSLLMRSQVYSQNNSDLQAFEDINAVIRIDPKYSNAYNLRAVYYKNQGQYELALKDFEKAISEYSENWGVYSNIVGTLLRMQQFNQAKKYADTYLEKSNSSDANFYYVSYLKLVIDRILQGEFQLAFEELEFGPKMIGDDLKTLYKSRYSNVLALKGYLLQKLSRYNEAKDIYEQALAINSKQPDIAEGIVAVNNKLKEIALADKTGPVIDIISPQPLRSFDIESDNGATQITGKAKDESGIRSISINGKTMDKIEADGLFITNLVLKPGPNPITVTAVDKQGNSTNQTFTLTVGQLGKKEVVPENPVTQDVLPKYYAIIIGEKDYNDPAIPDLQNPVKDGRDIKKLLESKYTFDPYNIDTLFNRSREEIMQAIVQRCNSLTKNDNLIIFYAGHGTAEKDKYGDIDGYWIPVSATRGQTASYISAEDINKAIKRSNAKHILVIADACFSGAFTRQLPPDASKGIQKQFKVPSRKVMASGNLEPVPDNSKFIYYLKKTLEENSDKYLSGKKLFDSFYDAILSNTENLPQYAAIKNVGDEGGEFVFIKR